MGIQEPYYTDEDTAVFWQPQDCGDRAEGCDCLAE